MDGLNGDDKIINNNILFIPSQFSYIELNRNTINVFVMLISCPVYTLCKAIMRVNNVLSALKLLVAKRDETGLLIYDIDSNFAWNTRSSLYLYIRHHSID